MYLDGEKALRWWHRNVARMQYALQGWKREKIYPDFIFAVQRDDSDIRIAVLEMKGQHLAGNEDTEYKRALLQLMSQNFSWEDAIPAGSMQLVGNSGETVECDLQLMNEWKAQLPAFLTK